MPRLNTQFAALGALSILAVAGGCASPVPGGGGILGKRLRVTMRFASPPDPNNFYYYFLINKFGPQGTHLARGPIPVLGYSTTIGGNGNGFATGSADTGTASQGDYGLTDYVLYRNGQPNGPLGIYHFPPNVDPNSLTTPNPGTYEGAPSQYTLPDLNNQFDTTAATTLTFEMPLSRLVTDTTNATQAETEAEAIQYIQVNIVTTNTVPINQAPVQGKTVDSIGDSTQISQLTSFLEIPLNQYRTYDGTQSFGTFTPEVANDLYPPGSQNPNIDLVAWSITVVPAG